MLRVGFVGWRGLVGSVLLQRMIEAQDLNYFQAHFFSTTLAGAWGPEISGTPPARLQNAEDLDALACLDVIITCQGSDYTQRIYHPLRQHGWQGYWIDAASFLRMAPDSLIALDPVNRSLLWQGLNQGIRTFVGGNCTVSLLLMALGGLFSHHIVEWISVATYQAASGAGGTYLRTLITQMAQLHQAVHIDHADLQHTLLEIERYISNRVYSNMPLTASTEVPLAYNVIPWIDEPMKGGQSREEWKATQETKKILGVPREIPIDGLCVRIGALRCHSQALTIKLTHNIALTTLEKMITDHNSWVELVANEPEATRQKLTPLAVAGTLKISVGRLRTLAFGPQYLAAFTVGDQLLWGAAEPLRRMLHLIREFIAC